MEVSNETAVPTATIEFREEPPVFTPTDWSTLGKMLAGNLPFKPKKMPPIRNAGPHVGRNETCPCGSGKKFKKCHLPVLETGVN